MSTKLSHNLLPFYIYTAPEISFSETNYDVTEGGAAATIICRVTGGYVSDELVLNVMTVDGTAVNSEPQLHIIICIYMHTHL